MAKKRIAADIDLCGNSVENVKDITASGKVTGNLDGALLDAVDHQGRVAALPFYSYTTLDMPTDATDDEYIQALLKKIVSDHSDLLGKTLVGSTQPNSLRNVILYTYPSGVVNDMPRYCSGVMSYGYSGEEYHFWINNGVFGSKTISDASGNLLGARTDHSGNVISTTYATKSEVSNKVTKNDPTGAVAYEGNLKFGTGSVSGSVNPVDMALIQECGANRFAFLPPECITIEYSRDAGTTWSDYGASDGQKVYLFSVKGAARFYVGKSSTSNPATADCRLRITLKTQTEIAKMYTALRKFFIWISTGSQASCWCTIRVRTMANIESGTDSWTTVADKVSISGDSGGNIINIPMIVTYNYQKSQQGEMQFIFGSDADATGGYAGLSIFNIFAFGDRQWTSQSEMAKTGHLYAYDYAQNATFPNGVKAKQFTGDLVGRANNALMDAENNNISATYLKKTDAESTYATKTTTNGLQSQISSMVSKTKNLSSDGSTFSGNAENDGDGNEISETYAKKTELSTYAKTTDLSGYAKKTDLNGYVLGETYSKHVQAMSDKTSQLSSDGSTFSGNAENDGDGNEISETYAKKTELSTYAKTTDLSGYAKKTDLNGYVLGETYSKHVQAMSDKTSQLSSDGSTFSGKVYFDGYGDDITEKYLQKTDLSAGDGLKLNEGEFSIKIGEQDEGFLYFDQGGLVTRGIDDAISDAIDEAKTDLSDNFATKSQYNSLNSQVQAQQSYISTLLSQQVHSKSGLTGTQSGPTSGNHIYGFGASGMVYLPSSGVTDGTRLTVVNCSSTDSVYIGGANGSNIYSNGSQVSAVTLGSMRFAECICMSNIWIIKL